MNEEERKDIVIVDQGPVGNPWVYSNSRALIAALAVHGITVNTAEPPKPKTEKLVVPDYTPLPLKERKKILSRKQAEAKALKRAHLAAALRARPVDVKKLTQGDTDAED